MPSSHMIFHKPIVAVVASLLCASALSVLAIAIAFPTVASASGLTNGASAVDALGQYDQTSLTAPVPVYTKGGANDGPNSLGYNLPTAPAVDAVHHRLFVSDCNNSRVLVYSLTSTNAVSSRFPVHVLGQGNFYSGSAAVTQGGMSCPNGLSYDAGNDRLFVADQGNRRVLVFATATITDGMNASYVLGQSSFTANAAATSQAGMSTVTGVLYAPSVDRLFVADKSNNRLLVFSLSGGIANGMNANSVLGQADFTSAAAQTTQSGMSGPYDAYYDAAHDRLYIADYGNRRILVFSGALLSSGMTANTVIGQAGFTTATSTTTQAAANTPYHLAYETTGDHLFVPEGENNNRVSVFNGAALATGMNASDALGQYDDTAADPQPVYVKNAVNNGPNRLGFNTPRKTAIDPVHHHLFVADENNNRVLVYALTSGNRISSRVVTYVLGQPNLYTRTAATTQTGMSIPIGLAYDGNRDRLFVADFSNNRVLVFSGASLSTGMKANTVLGQASFTAAAAATTQAGMSNPAGIAYDGANNHLFVAEWSNRRVLVFSGATLGSGMNANTVLGQANFTSATSAVTQTGMGNLVDLAYDTTGNRLFVADYSNNRVLTFSGAALGTGMSANTVLGQADFTHAVGATTQTGMRGPAGLAFDGTGKRLFVAEQDNNRVTAFLASRLSNGMSPTYVLGQTSFTASGAATTQTGMRNPDNLSYDGTNNYLLVSEFNNNRVLAFDVTPNDSLSVSIGSTSVTVTLTDVSRNTTAAADTVSVTLSDAQSDSETLLLTETGPETGIFTGSLRTGAGQVIPGDSFLEGSSSLITATYTDLYGGTLTASSDGTTMSTSGESQGTGGGRGRSVSRSQSSSSRNNASSAPASTGASSSSSFSSAPIPATGFRDVPAGAWYAAYVTELTDLHIVEGYKDAQGNLLHLFGPSDQVTYAQLAKLALGTAGEPADEGTGTNWALPYLRRSKDLGYSVFTTTLNPNAPAPRGAVVQTLLEALKVQMDAPSDAYRDVPASHPFAAAITTATRLGLIQGDTNADGSHKGTFRPNASVNRAEMAKVLILARKLKK